jgi:hypothetical protein
MLVVVALSMAMVAPVPIPRIDPATVQSGEVFELNVALEKSDKRMCSSILDVTNRLCPMVGRRYELKQVELTRILGLLNSATLAPKKSPACVGPRHAFVFKTTYGPRVVDVDFECHALNAHPMPKSVERELVTFLRSMGLVRHLPSAN